MVPLASGALRRGAAVFAARQRRALAGYAAPTPDPAPYQEPSSLYTGMELTFLGTSSQICPRGNPSSLALRLQNHSHTQLWLFDAGEGALAQLQRSHLRISQLRNIFITHMHPDHVFGLPGVVMSALAARDAPQQREMAAKARESGHAGGLLPPLTVFGPPGIRAYLRASLGATLPMFREAEMLRIVELVLPKEVLANRRLGGVKPFWGAKTRRLPFEVAAEPLDFLLDPETGNATYDVVDARKEDPRDEVGGGEGEAHVSDARHTAWPASVQAGLISHSVPCVAYVISEDVGQFRFDKEKLAALGLPTDGRTATQHLFQNLLQGNSVEHNGGIIRAADVSRSPRQPRRICICGDTSDASGVEHLAKGVDVLVHEATLRAADTDVARKRGHSSSVSAALFAKRVCAKRLVMNHTSVAYDAQEVRALESEARRVVGVDRAFVAHDMSVFNVPIAEADSPDYNFRSFLGFPRWGQQRLEESKDHPLSFLASTTAQTDENSVAQVDTETMKELDLALPDEGNSWLSVDTREKPPPPLKHVASRESGGELGALSNKQQARMKRIHLTEKDFIAPLKAFSNRRRSFAAV
jgi:ribonuclease Z